MSDAQRHAREGESPLKKAWETVRRAFVEFLGLPSLLIVGFLLLAAITSALDSSRPGWLEPLRTTIRVVLFRDAEATASLLSTIAGSIITVTSITFSLLLLAVQQAAGALTPVVYDQFLRRRLNQLYFGFFVGLAVYMLLILATVNRPYNPVFGATVALVLTFVAMSLIIVLLYTTINQMRPVVVIESIHDHILRARRAQHDFLRRTRREASGKASLSTPVRAAEHGYVVRVDLDAMAAALAETPDAEVVLAIAIGHYVAFEDMLATIRTTTERAPASLVDAVRNAIRLEQQRDLDGDPAYGIDQLAVIGWTSVSTAKSNPAPGRMVLHTLRDLMARWSAEGHETHERRPPEVPVVYEDNVFAKLLDTFEILAVVTSESMQSQTMASFVRSFVLMFGRLPPEQQPRARRLIRSSLSGLGEHVLTVELDSALTELAVALDVAQQRDLAAEVRAAHQAMSASLGKLGSRATRGSAGD
ncbi:DUF2254 family protein [Frateuria soli]|uniref:DUF2254 family protein n=1 Tax=Frateuria soli TaxID=1542730 RepID=UPI001E51BED0|nr:DUF2254 family protein [Frateuria soli]UGB39180.1 DUF2254 domain-containing protein [Frateuria soli]